MSRFRRMSAPFISILLAMVCSDVSPDDSITLTVHADRPGVRVSPMLYGVFFEEINHAGDGGLYAELVRNRSFREMNGERPVGWSLRCEGDAKATMTLDTDRPLNAANPRSMRLDVPQASANRVCVINDGYWGMAIRKGAAYNLTIHLRRRADLASMVTASLEGADGRVLSRANLGQISETWKRFTARLVSNADDRAARLVLSVRAPGSIWIGAVSLFPQNTFRRRSNGLCADLASLVRDLRPAFVRFPGGCFVEGNQLACAFRWKSTIGDIWSRPGHQNDVWGYYSTDGLGFHEYLQFCEDIGATPLYVINCGMAHRDVVAMDQLDPWVSDALDALEYANGPVTSKWGAMRARNGHSAPFHLRYIQIGNENGGPRYDERYARFHDAITAQYPDVQLVANEWGGTPKSRPIHIVDEHFYNSPRWFWSNAHLYDRRDRSGPKVYVGEYAVTQQCGRGNLRAALAEAAFMTGLERNSDHVVMSSYAPLFVNTHDRRWNPDLIVFDSALSYGTPSYYVQKLFAENRPDVILPIKVPEQIIPPTVEKGGIGLGTWATQAEFKDLEILQDGGTVYQSNFAQGVQYWKTTRGDWRVVDDNYRQSSTATDVRSVLTMPDLLDQSDYTIHLKARKLGGAEGFLILFRVRDGNNWYWWNVGGWGNREQGIEKAVNGSKEQVVPHVPGSIETDRWYDIRIELNGSRIRCYLDDRLIHDATDHGIPTLAAVAGRVERSREIILKVVNGSDLATTLDLNIEGVAGLQPVAQAFVLASSGMDDENTFESPRKVSPVVGRLTGIGRRFKHTFPPRSLTIMRLKSSAQPVAASFASSL